MTASHDGVTDEELVRLFNDGDASGFEGRARRYQRPLFNFILRSVRERDRAEELLQDVFLKVVQRSSEFQGNSKFSTWLYTIARNLCIDTSRKMVFRRHRSLDAPLSAADAEGGTMLDRVAGDEPAPVPLPRRDGRPDARGTDRLPQFGEGERNTESGAALGPSFRSGADRSP